MRESGIVWGVFITWLFGVVLTLTFWGAVIYAAVHFIHKLW